MADFEGIFGRQFQPLPAWLVNQKYLIAHGRGMKLIPKNVFKTHFMFGFTKCKTTVTPKTYVLYNSSFPQCSPI